MSDREILLEKMEKLKTLAERGVGGEKENAAALLARFMEKHGITEADLDDLKTQTYWIRYKTDWERRLIFQITYMHLGSGHAFGCVGTYTGRSRKKVGVDCTAAQYIEIQADFEFYNAHMADEMDLFYSAFLHKNHLFRPRNLPPLQKTTTRAWTRISCSACP